MKLKTPEKIMVGNKTLSDILKNHASWLNDGCRECADLRYANLECADLRDVNLKAADFRDADLAGAVLRDSTLIYANLRHVNLRGADLRGADLRGADLRYANLRCADLRDVNLKAADLRDADLSGSDLSDVKGLYFPYACPDYGKFIGWKKALLKQNHIDRVLIELEIPEDAKRVSATGRKCRCDKAKVLSIRDLQGNVLNRDEAVSFYNDSFVYKVGEMVSVSNFDENRWNECSTGIHFFINRQEAVTY